MNAVLTFLKSLRVTFLITLVIMLFVEVPAIMSMNEIGLLNGWRAFHFQGNSLLRFLCFTGTLFALIHFILLCIQRFHDLHEYDKKLEEEGSE